MATTTPREWTGSPSLNLKKVEAIKEFYRESLGDEDKAGSVEDCNFYTGHREALEWVLDLLFDTNPPQQSYLTVDDIKQVKLLWPEFNGCMMDNDCACSDDDHAKDQAILRLYADDFRRNVKAVEVYRQLNRKRESGTITDEERHTMRDIVVLVFGVEGDLADKLVTRP